MIDDGDNEGQLPWSGERYVPQVAGNIRFEHVHRYLLAREWCRGRRVLDIACGEGYGSAMLAEVAERVTGVDNAAEVVAHARRRYPRPTLDFTAGDCVAIPLLDASVDVVVSFETIEHHNRHDAMLREIKRVLRPGGRLIISSPDKKEYSDVPAYTNPFHVRELYRNEFEDLLATHFNHMSIAGQRVKAGSLIWPLGDAERAAFDGFEAGEGDGVRPIGAPFYLIAVASDEPVAPVPAGLFDGGAFVWSRDHVEAFQSVEAHYQAHFRQLTEERVQAEARTAATQAALEADHSRVSTLEAEVARFAHDVDALSAEKTELQRAVSEADQRLAQAHRDYSEKLTAVSLEHGERLAALSREHGQRMAEVSREHGQRMAEVSREHGQRMAEVSREHGQRMAEVSREHGQRMAEMSREHGRVVDQVRLMEGSHSWRLTAPLRAVRRAIQRRQPPFRMLQQSILGAYRALPLSVPARLKIRGGLFRAFPFLFRRTSAYRAWDAYRRTTERLQAPAPPHDSATAAVVLPDWFYSEAGKDYVPIAESAIVDTRIKAVAFYLPQFHPIPENDRWWGKGFTEWTNVSRGKPQFVGHYQPHLPGELGFYDLRNPDVQRRQIALARMYGLHGFCYHHYWFAGRGLLRRPLDQMLANPDMDFPFCLCWANENWTRRWDGNESEILIGQQHSPDDDLAFIREIEPAIRDPRYIRVGGRPLLVVYRPALLPDPRATSARWRNYCRETGIGDLYLVSTHAFDRMDPRELGFDAAMEFAPNNLGASQARDLVSMVNPDFQGTIYDYRYLVEYSRSYQAPSSYPLFRSVTPMWDNEARRPGRGTVFANSSPERYQETLENACRYTDQYLEPDLQFVFVNAWNEWAEGAHLEPDRRYGYAFLQATADALRRFPVSQGREPIVVVSHDAHFHGAQRVALTLVRTLSERMGYRVETLLCGDGPLRPEFEKYGRVHDFFSAESTSALRRGIVRELSADGARIALCNTSVVGSTVALLHDEGFRIVSMIHELPGLIKEHGLESSIAAITRFADRIVFPARMVRDRYLELTGLASSHAVVRPQGLLAPNRFTDRRDEARRLLRDRLRLGPAATIALGMGYADRRKGLDLFVEAGLTMLGTIPDLTMVWVGHSDAATLAAAHARISETGSDAHFLFPGLVEESDLFFAGADVYLMTSREDPFPLVVLHALDAEIPVVGFEGAGGFVELLSRGCGILVPYLDATAMATAAARVLARTDERERLIAAGRTIVDREFDFLSYARFLVGLAAPDAPTVSVVVPNYNYARHLPARLTSILAQTYRPHEIIFLDDCSSDGSVEVAEGLLQDAQIPYRIIRNETNQGCYRQWLKGLREASGDLVWIAEADDDCAPNLLETLVPAFATGSVVLSYCQSRQIDDEGRELAPDYLAWTANISDTKWRHGYVRRGVDEVCDTLVIKNTIPNVSGVLLRKTDLSALEDQLVTLRNAGDWLVYAHVLERGDIAYVPAPLNYHRRHLASLIGKGGLNLMKEILQVQGYIKERHSISSDTEQKRMAELQTTYEYLRLDADGPASYQDHEALRPLTSTLVG